MDEKQIQAIKAFARKRFLRPEDAEDFVQNVCEKYLNNRKATLRQLHIDELRNQNGSTRNGNKPCKKIPNRDLVTFHENMLKLIPPDHLREKIAETKLNILYQGERVALILRDLWGFDFKEIGFVLGQTEQGAHHLYTSALKDITE